MLNSIVGVIGTGGVAATDFESISTVTVGGGGASSITFSSIPATYQHLQIRGIAKTSNLGWVQVKFNSDSGANYSQHELRGDGSSATAAGSASTSLMQVFLQNASQVASGVIDILDYANTSKYKTIRTLGGFDDNGASTGYITLTSGNWRNTNAITDITINHSTSSFTQYSQFALYGIKG